MLNNRHGDGNDLRCEAPVARNSAAAGAVPAFDFGDQIIATTDPDHPDQVTELPKDPRDPTGKQYDYFTFGRRSSLKKSAFSAVCATL